MGNTSVNKIDRAFAELKEQGRAALMPFLVVGDPDIDTSVDIMLRLQKAGASMIEMGVPYSDPLADGPVNQRASLRALRHRITVIDCIQAASKARAKGVTIPLILFTYYNPLLQIGLDRVFELLLEHDISGLIIPDLPIEEDAPVRERGEKHGIHLIPLVAPTSKDRVARIASRASGFVYCVSSLGVTGERAQFYDGLRDFVGSVKSAASVPAAIGFGISTREQVVQLAGISDGIIIGSAIVRQIEEVLPLLQSAATKEEGLDKIEQFVSGLRP